MQSYLRLGAAAVLFSLLMMVPVALCIVLDSRPKPAPVPLPEPTYVPAGRFFLGEVDATYVKIYPVEELPDCAVPVEKITGTPANAEEVWDAGVVGSVHRLSSTEIAAMNAALARMFRDVAVTNAAGPAPAKAAAYHPNSVLPLEDLGVGDELTFDDGERLVRLRVVQVTCNCPICQMYRDKYPDWESTSHYHKTHRSELRRP